MSEAVSQERCQILSALGADFLRTPARLGTDGAIEAVYRLQRRSRASISSLTSKTIPQIRWPTITGLPSKSGNRPAGGLRTWSRPWDVGTLMGREPAPEGVEARGRIVGVEPYLGHKIQASRI